MRLAFLILGLFLVFVSARARELTPNESFVLIPYKKNTKEVRQYFLENIDPSQLSWGEWAKYQVMKRACDPLELHLRRIERSDERLLDQSKELTTLYGACSEGSLNLAALYISQK